MVSVTSDMYIYVGLIGFLVGTTEIVSRYKDNPWLALQNIPAFTYITINVAASLLALLLIESFQITFDSVAIKNKWFTILVAGTSAMAFFRTSLFTYRVGDKDLALGPGLLFQILLDVTDRSVDRSRAKPRSLVVSNIMRGIDFTKAMLALPTYCFALMQNVSSEEQAAIAKEISALSATSNMSDSVKSLVLGLTLINIVGEAVLKAAVEALSDELKP